MLIRHMAESFRAKVVENLGGGRYRLASDDQRRANPRYDLSGICFEVNGRADVAVDARVVLEWFPGAGDYRFVSPGI